MIAGRVISSASDFVLPISSSVASPNIRALALAAGWTGYTKLIVNITAPLINTLDLGSTAFANGIRLNFLNASTRVGGVLNGGTAFKSRVPVEISAVAGVTFAGGGGKGGSGGTATANYGSTVVSATGGIGGDGQGFANASSLTIQNAGGSSAGTYQSAAVVGGTMWAQGGTSGTGGAWGASGQPGGTGSVGGPNNSSSLGAVGSGAAAGLAVDGESYVTWVSLPTFQGARAN